MKDLHNICSWEFSWKLENKAKIDYITSTKCSK